MHLVATPTTNSHCTLKLLSFLTEDNQSEQEPATETVFPRNGMGLRGQPKPYNLLELWLQTCLTQHKVTISDSSPVASELSAERVQKCKWRWTETSVLHRKELLGSLHPSSGKNPTHLHKNLFLMWIGRNTWFQGAAAQLKMKSWCSPSTF